ncbi:hypothetical protein [Cellulomonas massiliensis]|uniref:hypothetical protein n=1 Tax=Cellulomonas massiliensis TaxID=1465811 RepID=UPI0011CA2BA6|nr:hypothetical protein [Cellulomonas massiliensis]
MPMLSVVAGLLAARDPLLPDERRWTAGLAWPLFGAVALTVGTSLLNIASINELLAGGYVIAIAVTGLRPALLMDQLFSAAWLRRPAQARLRRRMRISVAAFIGLGIGWALLLEMAPPETWSGRYSPTRLARDRRQEESGPGSVPLSASRVCSPTGA